MKYEQVIENLLAYTKDEKIYKEYYNMAKDGDTVDFFLRKYANDPENQEYLDYLFHPEQINQSPPEELFITIGRNVSLVRHPRYFPLFYHEHTFFEILYVLTGSCNQILTDQKVCLQEGDLCIMAPHVTHGIEVFDDSLVINILIRRNTFLDIFFNTIRDKTQISYFFLNNLYSQNRIPYLLFFTNSDETIRNYILDMYLEQQIGDKYTDRITCSLLTIFLTQLIRRHGDHMEIPAQDREKTDLEKDLFDYIVKHYQELTLEKLAGKFHFSAPYCSKLIQKMAGVSFSELQENIRLQQSENYLLYTQMSVAEISENLGYKNPETFIRMFKRRKKMTPSDFRRMHPGM